MDPSLSIDLFGDAVKYLGIFLGPGAFRITWNEACRNYLEVIKFLRHIDAGFTPTVSLYNVLGASTCSWVGSFYPPSEDLLTLERKSLQRITHGPWNVFPLHMLFSLRRFGYPLQFQSLELNSWSARARNGINSITNFPAVISSLSETLVSDERVLKFSHFEWVSWSCCSFIQDAMLRADETGFVTSGAVTQSLLSKHFILLRSHFDIASFLIRRIGRFLPHDDISVPYFIELFNWIGRRFKPCVLHSYIITILNGWCTTSRFGNDTLSCSFCGLAHLMLFGTF